MHKRLKIYKSIWYILGTIGFIVVPFLFLLAFTSYSNIALLPLLHDFESSFFRILIAYLISVILAWVFAVIFYKGKAASIGLPIFDVLQSFPTFAALPLAVYLWGSSALTVVLFLIVTIIWPIFFSIVSSLKLIRHDWDEVAQIANLKGFNYFKKFLLPITIPGLITGSIIGLGEGWEALVATEIIVNLDGGLGSFFRAYSSNTEVTILGILGFLLLIFSINKLIWLPLLDVGHKMMEE